eukprot:4076874-Pleurochrysis_carterae.AAC.4
MKQRADEPNQGRTRVRTALITTPPRLNNLHIRSYVSVIAGGAYSMTGIYGGAAGARRGAAREHATARRRQQHRVVACIDSCMRDLCGAAQGSVGDRSFCAAQA